MAENVRERRLLIRSQMAEGYHWSQAALNNLQHVFTDWFPRVAYYDLTDDTDHVDVVVRKDFSSGKGIFTASFIRADGSVIKSTEYDESKMIGKPCEHYDPKRAHYEGKKDGFDQRLVIYSKGPVTAASRPK